MPPHCMLRTNLPSEAEEAMKKNLKRLALLLLAALVVSACGEAKTPGSASSAATNPPAAASKEASPPDAAAKSQSAIPVRRM